jgi:hypothetical protein
MASLDYDQKILGRLARDLRLDNPIVSSAYFQILGLSIELSKKLLKARKLRKLDTTRDTKSLTLYHHIIWLSREGLDIVNKAILPYVMQAQHGVLVRVLSLKLRASFYHIICLFHNQPPVSQISIPAYRAPLAMPDMPLVSQRELDHLQGNRNRSTGNDQPARNPTLREPVTSIVSEGSVLTNPYPMDAPPGLAPVPVSHPMAYLIPHRNYLPLTDSFFDTAYAYASTSLPGSHPLRLSVALEYTAFLWDCQHDYDKSRATAAQAIRDTYTAEEGMEDDEFRDASEMVRTLHRMMKRENWEGTPKTSTRGGTPQQPYNTTNGAAIAPLPTNSAATVTQQRSPSSPHRGQQILGSPFLNTDPAQRPGNTGGRRRRRSGSRSSSNGKSQKDPSPRSKGGNGNRKSTSSGSEATPRAAPPTNRMSAETSGSATPRASAAPRDAREQTSSTTPRAGTHGRSSPRSNHRISSPRSPQEEPTYRNEPARGSPKRSRAPSSRTQPTPVKRTAHTSPRGR